MVHGLVIISLKFGWRSKNLIILICGRLKRNRKVLDTNGSKKITILIIIIFLKTGWFVKYLYPSSIFYHWTDFFSNTTS